MTPMTKNEYFLVDDGAVAFMFLTQDQVTFVDSADLELVGTYRWCSKWQPCSQSFRAVTSLPKARGGPRLLYMAGLILFGEVGKGDRTTADHINRDTLDNRRGNLRPATRIQQGLNQKPTINGSSSFVGVCRHRRGWQAVGVYGQYIGRYADEAEAARARDANLRATLSAEDQSFVTWNFPKKSDNSATGHQ